MLTIKDVASARRLGMLLIQKKPTIRTFYRGRFAVPVTPKPPFIWGGQHFRYGFWWGLCCFASTAVPCILGVWASSQGRTMPGGAYNLLVFLVVFLGGPVLPFLIRARELRSRNSIEASAFAAGIRKVAPAVPEGFAFAVRSALAAAYCVPVELIGYADTRWQSKALSLMSEPLAIEIIAHVCQSQGIEIDLERMRSAAEFFRANRPSTIADIVGMMHKEMLSAKLIEK